MNEVDDGDIWVISTVILGVHTYNIQFMAFTVVLVPCDDSKPLESHDVLFDDHVDNHLEKFNSLIDATEEHHEVMDVLMMPLVRPHEDCSLHTEIPGLFAYYHQDVSETHKANIRATRLAMACGLLSIRFYGNVLLVRSRGALSGDKRWENLDARILVGPCCVSPDLRQTVQERIAESLKQSKEIECRKKVPDWIPNAAQQNYHDAAAMAHLASVMNISELDQHQRNDSDDDVEGDSDASSSDHTDKDRPPSQATETSTSTPVLSKTQEARSFVTKKPLCLHCRGLSSCLCQGCEGAYFCEPPRQCRVAGWSHACLCATWKFYCNRREELSKFEFLGDWQHQLIGRSFQMGEEPYRHFLSTYVGIDDPQLCTSWWRTEIGGWAGGQSDSASSVDATIRRSYSDGFAPLDSSLIPPQRPVAPSDFDNAGIQNRKNSLGFSVLSGGWADYYKLRGIPSSSPIALLCSFPLTIYHAIVRYGEVPATVATMLNRPLRIHIVGAEKELNSLDLFAEIGFLLPEHFKVRRKVKGFRLFCILVESRRVNASKKALSHLHVLLTLLLIRSSWFLWCERICFHPSVATT